MIWRPDIRCRWGTITHVMKLLAVAGISAMLAACSATELPNTSALASADQPSNSPFPETGAEKKFERMPNPLADPSTQTVGAGREVIESPTMDDILATGPLPDMVFGAANAPVTIVEYASLTCPHCRNFHRTVFPELKRTYIDTGKVRFILREFPIGRTSGMATIALRCAPKDKYLELFGKYLDQQASWVSQEVRLDPIFAVAKQVGMNRATFDACRQNQTMIEGLKWVKERGRKLGIIGTPNFFVGTKRFKRVLTMEDIRALVEPELQGRSVPTASATPG